MTYVKLCQICDKGLEGEDLDGAKYIETVSGEILTSVALNYPLEVIAEVFDFVTEDNFKARRGVTSFGVEIVTVPNNSISIRQSVYNQLLEKYPNLVK